MPDPDKLLNTLYKAVNFTRRTPGRQGKFVQLPPGAEIVVGGDLHGHIGNFQAIYKAADLANQPQRHLVIQELIHSKFSYPMGGDKSHQLIDLYAALKCQYPERVHYLMGNHELAQWSNRAIMKNDVELNQHFLNGVLTAYGSEKGQEIYNKYMELIATIPIAIRTDNRVMLSHSLPRGSQVVNFNPKQWITEVLTPQDCTTTGYAYEITWGRDTREHVCKEYLDRVNCDYLISGHIICPEMGYDYPNPRQLIVDSCSEPASYALIPGGEPLTAPQFSTIVRLINP